MRQLLKNMERWLFPNFCLGCQQVLYQNQQILCLNCQNALASTGKYVPNNFTEQVIWGRFHFEYAFSTFYFTQNAVIQSLMHALKYEGHEQVAVFLGDHMAHYIKKHQLSRPNSVLVPVPLSKKRMLERGYNQSELICNRIGKVLDIPVLSTSILRIKNTATQVKKNRTERLSNMELAFDINNSNQLAGHHIILVDDTITTGATIEACALELLKIPTTTISVATAAIAMY